MRNFYDFNPNYQTPSNDASNSVILDLNVPLHNDEFYKLFDEYCITPNEMTQNNLGMHLNKMHYLLGIILDENTSIDTNINQITIQKGDALNFLICSNEDREVFLPVFTDDAELKNWYTESIHTLSVPAAWLWKFVLTQKSYAGILINPNGIAWSINPDHIQSLLSDLTE